MIGCDYESDLKPLADQLIAGTDGFGEMELVQTSPEGVERSLRQDDSTTKSSEKVEGIV